MRSFMSPKAALRLGLKATKVAKPIQVWLTQWDVTPTKEVMFGIKLFCSGMKFKEDFMIIALNGFDVILGNTFLDAYHINMSHFVSVAMAWHFGTYGYWIDPQTM